MFRYLTFTRLEFTCIRCIAVSEEIIPNKVNHGGSPTIYFALPPFLNSSSKWGGVGRLGWWLTAGVPISTCKSSLTPVHKCLCWMLVNMWLLIRKQLIRHQFSLFQRNCRMFACDLVADCPAVSLDLYIFRIELEFYMHKVNVGAKEWQKTLPKALRTQVLTALTSDFGLVGLVQYAW